MDFSAQDQQRSLATKQNYHQRCTRTTITEAETNIIVLLGALSAFVDALYDETSTGDEKDANLVTLDDYMKTFEKKRYPYAVIQQGRGILIEGRRRLEEKLV